MDAEKATVALKEVKAYFGLDKNKTVSYFCHINISLMCLVFCWFSTRTANQVSMGFCPKKVEFF